jgi:hypothetical protein
MRWGEGREAASRRHRLEQREWMPHFFYIPRLTGEHGWIWLEDGERKRMTGSRWDMFEYRARGLHNG